MGILILMRQLVMWLQIYATRICRHLKTLRMPVKEQFKLKQAILLRYSLNLHYSLIILILISRLKSCSASLIMIHFLRVSMTAPSWAQMSVISSDLKESKATPALVAVRILKCTIKRMWGHLDTCQGVNYLLFNCIKLKCVSRPIYQGNIYFCHWEAYFRHPNPDAGAVMSVSHLALEKVCVCFNICIAQFNLIYF